MICFVVLSLVVIFVVVTQGWGVCRTKIHVAFTLGVTAVLLSNVCQLFKGLWKERKLKNYTFLNKIARFFVPIETYFQKLNISF